ncbi:MAG: polysaccharide deacetylase family protein [Alphaproteobacteria bacterium]|nr:polysaccharide deacetylase family protein [Alphaproteobacteria bacterium]
MTVCLMLHGLGAPPSSIGTEERPYWATLHQWQMIMSLAPHCAVEITIDDGNKSDVEIALPALRSVGMRATFFIPSDRLGAGPHYLTEDDVRLLHRSGMEIGSHGCAHLHWTKLPNDSIVNDITCSIKRLSAITGATVRSVAIPFGDFDRRVLGVLRSLGVGRVYTSLHGPDSGNGWIVRRDCIRNRMSDEDITTLMTDRPSLPIEAIAFLRTLRHAGRAALWHA